MIGAVDRAERSIAPTWVTETYRTRTRIAMATAATRMANGICRLNWSTQHKR